jgi:hypothetical protein
MATPLPDVREEVGMTRDMIVFLSVVLLASSGLAYSYGYQHGQDVKPCPEQDGYKVAYSIKQGADTKCVYVQHTRGMVLKTL